METKTRKWILVAGARPNFMKVAPLIRAIHNYNIRNENLITSILVHTGQHYDENMSSAFFQDLHIPEPDIHLRIGSGTHAEQTGRVMIEFEKVLLSEKPDIVIVFGDINSTMACALGAVKLHIPVAHVEAGLRSFDRTMPEEINRLVTDAVADFLFTPSPDADENLLREGIPKEKIFLVGNIMVDSLLYNLELAEKTTILEQLSLKKASNVNPYALVTLHRPANVDNRKSFALIIDGLLRVSEKLLVFFPIHPRTYKQVKAFDFEDAFEFHSTPNLVPKDYYVIASPEEAWQSQHLKRKIHAFNPLGYLDFLNLMAHATVVITDSGGIQEETTVLNIPCITLRNTTERPITVIEGTNILIPNDPDIINSEINKVLNGQIRQGKCPDFWDGRTAERIVEILTSLGHSIYKTNFCIST